MMTSQQIDTALFKIDLEAKKTRRKIGSRILGIVLLVVLFFVLPYSYPQLYDLYAFDLLIGFGGAAWIFFSGIWNYIQPLGPEYYAFKKIVDAIHILEKLKEDIGYAEACRNVETAYRTLNNLSLDDDIVWYKAINETFKKFLTNLKQIILPAIKDTDVDSVTKVEHLKQIALAIYSFDPAKLSEINKMLEEDPCYKKSDLRAKVKVELGDRVRQFLKSPKTLKAISAICLLVVGCGIFYYLTVNYLNVPNGYALTGSVAAFLGLLAIYSQGKRKSVKELESSP